MDAASFQSLTPGQVLNIAGKSYRVEKVGERWERKGGEEARILELSGGDIREITVTLGDPRYVLEAGTFIYTKGVSPKLRLFSSRHILPVDIESTKGFRLTHHHPAFVLAQRAIKLMQRKARKAGLTSLQSVAEATLTSLDFTLTYIKGDNRFLERVLLKSP